MIEKFTIEGFKKFKKISLEDLSHINIFVGVNNVGKTTILEAIMGFSSGWNLPSILNLSVWRRFYPSQGLNSYQLAELTLNAFHDISENKDLSFTFRGLIDAKEQNFIHSLMPGQIIASCIPGNNVVVDGTEIIHRQVPVPIPVVSTSTIMLDTPSQYLGQWSIQSGKEKKTYELSSPISFNQFPNEKPFIMAMFHDIFSHRNEVEARKIYSFLINSDALEKFIEELNRSFEGLKIKNINNIPYPDGTEAPISVQFEDNTRRPLYTLGDGLRRWYALLGGMITFKNSIHCIEEADVTFHYKAQDSFAINLKHYAEKFDNQIFMTTHNMEYLNIFLHAIEKSDINFLKEKLRVITLRDYSGVIKYRILNGLEALKAIQNELELRI